MITHRVVTLISCWALAVHSGKIVNVKQHADCDKWAQEGECVKNPAYMWVGCHGSCMTGPSAAKDIRKECQEWVSVGECTNNPAFIQLHCPESCNRAVGWSPWARRAMQIEPYLPYNDKLSQEECPNPVDVLGAADLLRGRLSLYIQGGSSSVTGLSSAAPSEYLGMMGLAEAFLYAFRLYRSVMRPNHAHLADSGILLITTTLQQGYHSDLLMRQIPTWVPLLDEVALLSREGIVASEEPCRTEDTLQGPSILSLSTAKTSKNDMTSLNSSSTFVLSNGVEMPVLGLGTWQLNGEECEQTVHSAIMAGYRHFDSAQAYHNEVEIGKAVARAIQEGIISRKELFLATKLSDPANAGKGVQDFVTEQLKNLQTDYIDLYMLHSPLDAKLQAETWTALEELYDRGVIKALGVSNFDGRELKALIKTARVKPMVVQNKLDIYHVGKQLDNVGDDIVEVIRANGIILVAYSPFSAYPFVLKPSDDPVVRYIAERRNAVLRAKASEAAQAAVAATSADEADRPPVKENSEQKDNLDAKAEAVADITKPDNSTANSVSDNTTETNSTTPTAVTTDSMKNEEASASKSLPPDSGSDAKLAVEDTPKPSITPANVPLVTPAQLILRWALQNGFAVIPRSSNPARLVENISALSISPLTDEEMNLISSIQFLTSSPVSKAVAI